MNEPNNEPNIVEGIIVETACQRTEVDCSPFIDCLQAIVSRDSTKLAGSFAVLTYLIVTGDIFKSAD